MNVQTNEVDSPSSTSTLDGLSLLTISNQSIPIDSLHFPVTRRLIADFDVHSDKFIIPSLEDSVTETDNSLIIQAAVYMTVKTIKVLIEQLGLY